jgi:hypothetical protein
MRSGVTKRFDSVTIGDEWGVAGATGFHQTETHRLAPPGYPFSVCRIGGRQTAVFIEIAIPVELRAELMSLKPDWLDAIVYARAISDPRAEVAVIEAHVLKTDDAELQMCAFATACVAFNLGLFTVVPKSYLVRFEGEAPVRVSAEFDDDTASWFGEAASEPSLEKLPLTRGSGNEPTS